MMKKKYLDPQEREEIRKKYIGKRAWLKFKTLEFKVEIIDACSGPAKVDFKIVPLWGFGSKWVDLKELNFHKAILADDSGLYRQGMMRLP